MPFTDLHLAAAMGTAMVQANVMTQAQYEHFIDNDRTEEAIRDTLTHRQILAFPRYWLLINRWLVQNGGTVKTIRANYVAGRIPGEDPVARDKKIMYDDAFAQTQRHIATDGFSDVKAISNALRFIERFLND